MKAISVQLALVSLLLIIVSLAFLDATKYSERLHDDNVRLQKRLYDLTGEASCEGYKNLFDFQDKKEGRANPPKVEIREVPAPVEDYGPLPLSHDGPKPIRLKSEPKNGGDK